MRGKWDRTRLEQVITNLGSNATKYGNGKPVSISLQKEAGIAVISVKDQGIGIPQQAQTKIFDRFERANPDARISGLGLGLYITKQIVEAHGGRIEVSSHPGEGATFKVTLPSLEARLRAGLETP